jgi:starch synthase
MYSLKYGTVPIVRKTGGLADTVRLYDWKTGIGTGFVFDHYVPDALRWALDYSLDVFGRPEPWRRLMLNGMACDYSWEVQGREYVELYTELRSRSEALT